MRPTQTGFYEYFLKPHVYNHIKVTELKELLNENGAANMETSDSTTVSEQFKLDINISGASFAFDQKAYNTMCNAWYTALNYVEEEYQRLNPVESSDTTS